MDSTDPTAVIILSEIVAIQAIIIIGFAVAIFIKKKKTTKQLKTIINDNDKNITTRKSSLQSTYSNTLSSGSNDPDKIIDDLIKHETEFLQMILETFNKNDITSIKHIEEGIHELVSPYVQLIPDKNIEPKNLEDEETVVPDIDSTIDDLLADEADDAEGDPLLDLSEEIEYEDENEAEKMTEELLSDNKNADLSPEATDKIAK